MLTSTPLADAPMANMPTSLAAVVAPLPTDKRGWRLDGVKSFAGLTPEQIGVIETRCTWRRFEANTTIFDRNQPPNEVYFLVAGTARVCQDIQREGQDPDEVTFATIEAGDSFGELSAIDGKGRSAKVVTNEESVVAVMLDADFRHVLTQFPSVAFHVVNRFAGIIRTLDNRIADMSRLTPDQRVYCELLRLARAEGDPAGLMTIRDLPNHIEIAGWSNTTREQVAMAIANLVRRGVAERKHKTFYIRDPDALRALAR